jgi:DNA repair ATPase RecN
MRTKIEYSMDLKDVPQTLKEKLKNLSSELARMSHYVESIGEDLEHDNVNAILGRLDRARRRLFECDQSLSNCDNAVKTYTQAITELHAEQAPPETAEGK